MRWLSSRRTGIPARPDGQECPSDAAIFLAAATLLWLALPLPIRAQENNVRTIPFEGPEIVCHILHHLRLEPITQIQAGGIDPRDTIIIVFGKPDIFQDILTATDGVGQFLARGGSLLLATDYLAVVPDVPVHVSGVQLGGPGRRFGYRGVPECPWLSYPQEEPHRDHPLFHFLQKGIATNRPSFLTLQENDLALHTLLTFPHWGNSYMIGSAGDAPPRGRVLVIAGHGMFMNGMMLQTDNDNFAFTVNAMQWLREAPQGKKRSRALFVVDGTIIEDFDVKLTPPPPPVPLPTVKMINRLLRGLENERFFHRIFEDIIGDEARTLVTVLLALATLGLLIYGAKKITEGRYLLETNVPLTVGPQAASSTAPLLRQRHRALLRKEDLYEEARALVHEWYREQFGIAPDEWARGFRGELHLHDKAVNHRFLQRVVGSITRLAHGDAAYKVTHVEFVALVHALPELDEAVKEKRLTLHAAEKKVRQSPGETN